MAVFVCEVEMEGDVNSFNDAVGIDELKSIPLRRGQRLQSMTARSRRGRGRGGGRVFSVSAEHLVPGVQQTAPFVHVESADTRSL